MLSNLKLSLKQVVASILANLSSQISFRGFREPLESKSFSTNTRATCGTLAKRSSLATKPSNSLASRSIPSLSIRSDSAILSWHCQAGHARLRRATWQKCNAGFPARNVRSNERKKPVSWPPRDPIAFSASPFRKRFLARTTRFYQLLLTSTGDRGLDAAACLLDSVYSIADKWCGERGSLRGGEFWSVWWWIAISIHI